MRLVSFALGFFDGLRKQKRAFNRTFKGQRRRDVTFQMRDHRGAINDLAVARRNIAGYHQCNSDYPVQVGQGRSMVEVNDGHRGAGNSKIVSTSDIQQSFTKMSNYGCGILCHDGSYNLFKWDRAKGCMVPFKVSNPKPEFS
jgi:hypothetical protein